MSTRISGWLQALAARVKRWFTFQEGEHKPVPSPGTPGNDLDEDESYEEYIGKINGMDDIVAKLGIQKRISASHKYMYEMGRRDGALGVTLHNLPDVARAVAQDMFRHVYVILSGKKGALGAELDAANNVKQNDQALHDRELAYYDYVKYQYRFFPRSYSIFLFFIYLIFAAALIIADMPLAVKLIQNGFDLGGDGFEDIFKPGKFWSVIAANWETTITAVGIALCTIYIKIYYDEYVGTPYANRLMTFKKFLEENNIPHADQTEESIRKEDKSKTKWKTGLFILTLLSIMILAIFRLETAQSIEGFYITPFAGAAFVAITLLFPLIGGVCLSYAFNNLQNLLRLYSAKTKWLRCRKRLLRAVKALTIVTGNHEDIAAAAERLGNESKVVEDYKNYLEAFYWRGYAIGGMQPEKYTRGEDFYSKILEWRNIAISRKINHHIGKLN